MFFQKFPKTSFDLNRLDKIIVTDIIRGIKIDPSLKENDLFYNIYQAKDGETPEIISHKVYGTVQFHWVIMLINEKFDWINDFPQPDTVIQKYCLDTYSDINGVHHYIDSSGNWVDEFSPDKIPVTNIEHERLINEEKRSVKILKRDILDEFVLQAESLLRV